MPLSRSCCHVNGTIRGDGAFHRCAQAADADRTAASPVRRRPCGPGTAASLAAKARMRQQQPRQLRAGVAGDACERGPHRRGRLDGARASSCTKAVSLADQSFHPRFQQAGLLRHPHKSSARCRRRQWCPSAPASPRNPARQQRPAGRSPSVVITISRFCACFTSRPKLSSVSRMAGTSSSSSGAGECISIRTFVNVQLMRVARKRRLRHGKPALHQLTPQRIL